MGPEVPAEDLSKLADGARMAGALPYIRHEVDRMENALIRRVMASLDDGALTPDAALYAWMELAAYRRLEKRLTTITAVGQTAAERVKPAMDQD